MLSELWNPSRPTDAEYVELLNRCFGGGWDEATFEWYLAREFAGRSPDRLVLAAEDSAAAGSVVNYRELESPSGEIVTVGIASGSWTLPEHRGQGLFTRMMEASVRRAGDRGCTWFLAFVTADNPSRRALERMGASMVPAAYLVDGEGAARGTESVTLPVAERSAPTAAALERRSTPSAAWRFHYRNASDWRRQMIDRVHPVERLSVGDHLAIVERTPDTDRLQWTSARLGDRAEVARALAWRALDADRRFFMYGTGDWTAECATGAGLETRPGFITCLPTRRTGTGDRAPEASRERWDVHSGDRL